MYITCTYIHHVKTVVELHFFKFYFVRSQFGSNLFVVGVVWMPSTPEQTACRRYVLSVLDMPRNPPEIFLMSFIRTLMRKASADEKKDFRMSTILLAGGWWNGSMLGQPTTSLRLLLVTTLEPCRLYQGSASGTEPTTLVATACSMPIGTN